MTAALTGAEELQTRWLRVLKAEDDALGFAIGRLYVVQKFPPAWKQAAGAVVARIRDALHDDLNTLSWMSPATRSAAQQKLALMQLRIGYPEQWRDYGGLAVDRGPYVRNVMRANAFEVQRPWQLEELVGARGPREISCSDALHRCAILGLFRRLRNARAR
jgi:putative endopeptidase